MILSIDTSSPFLVLGLLSEGTRVELSGEVGRGHAEQLAGELTRLFQVAGRPPHAEQIVVGTGPGSYTGLRVGASFALGLGRAWGVPVLGISSLEGVAAQVDGSEEVSVAVSVDARRGQVYGALYRVQNGLVTQVLSTPQKCSSEDFGQLAQGAVWLRDEPPTGLGLARLATTRGQLGWQLQYA